MKRCAKTAPQPKTPDGLTIEAMRTHPTWKWWIGKGARCILEQGHEGPHRAQPEGDGGLIWWDPPIVIIAGGRQ